jgi:hypothetical protein
MRRREFITLVAAPLAAHAQQRREAARSDCSIPGSLRIDLESDPVASGLGVAVVSKAS